MRLSSEAPERRNEGGSCRPSRPKKLFLPLFALRRAYFPAQYDNAVKYNRPGGRVVISTGTEGGHAYMQVSDTGIGIPAADRERVFERFYRVDKSRSKQIGGTGLGLSIVKHGAMFHHARVSLESEPNKGTTVRVTF